MPTVLRNGRTVPNADEMEMKVEINPDERAARQTRSRSRSRSRSKPSPYLLLVYPVLLAIGSLFSVLSPVASTPETKSRSFFPSTNYFAGKRNIVNLYFVKIGWFWTTLAFAFLQFTTRPPVANKQKHYIQAFTRYAITTLSWILVTQWFLGPPLIDRSFTVTGGHCEAPPAHDLSEFTSTIDLQTLSSATACKTAGGRWRGGHDISGHIFMLVLSSAFLIYELYIADVHSTHPSVSPGAAAKLAHDLTEEEKNAMGGWESETEARVRVYSRYFLWGVVALDFWMIMMTSIWFHTWPEKLSGLTLAAASLWGVYFLPEMLPQWRHIVGGFE